MGELVPVARVVNDDYANRTPGISVILARALADHPSGHDEARALMKDLADDGFAKLPLGTFWSSALIVGAEAACLLDLPEVCSTIRDLLEPFVDQVAFTGLFVTAPICVRRCRRGRRLWRRSSAEVLPARGRHRRPHPRARAAARARAHPVASAR